MLLGAASGDELARLVERRLAGDPLEHLLGWADFAGVRVVVAPGVFVPRQRSALLVDLAVDLVAPAAAARVLDLCCGSGAIGTAIAARLPAATVWASDVDPAAVACARRNLPSHHVVQGDLYAALPADLRGSFDAVVANAPYVPTEAIAGMPPEARDHEPRAALDGGVDGTDLQRRVAVAAGAWLAPGGRLLVETSRGQAADTLAAITDAGLAGRIVRDDDRDATAVVGVAP